jgi:hypothetical protein
MQAGIKTITSFFIRTRSGSAMSNYPSDWMAFGVECHEAAGHATFGHMLPFPGNHESTRQIRPEQALICPLRLHDRILVSELFQRDSHARRSTRSIQRHH